MKTPSEALLSCAEEGLLSAIFSSPQNNSPFDKIRVRSLQDGKDTLQLEQFKGPKVFHRNVNAVEFPEIAATWIPEQFSRAELTTGTRKCHLMANRKGRVSVLVRPAAPVDTSGAPATARGSAQPSTPASGHNRVKQYILEEGTPVPFLIDLGVMTEDGTVIRAKYDKFRQINRFLEFVADVLPELLPKTAVKPETQSKVLRVLDFGCGKSYLTFAVYYYLTVLKGFTVRMTGLDLKEDVIAECSQLSARYGYSGLDFQVGDIAGYTAEPRLDMVISLHACDLATDYALHKAVCWEARVILAVPCCQHELNAQIGAQSAHLSLDTLLRHGILRERFSALATDALRAELLETAGYRVQILEFIDMSHTPKNLLIRAVRSPLDKAALPATANRRAAAAKRYEALRGLLAVQPTLAKLLAETKEKAGHE